MSSGTFSPGQGRTDAIVGNAKTTALHECRSCDNAVLCLGASSAQREAALNEAAQSVREAGETMPTRVVVCGDQPIMRSALHLLIDTRANYRVTIEASICVSALRLVVDLEPDVVLLDFNLTDSSNESLQQLQELMTAAPSLPALILTDDPDPEACHQAFQFGVRGLVLKSKTLDDLFGAIDRIRRGDTWLEGPALQKLLTQSSRNKKQSPEAVRIAQLTKREREIVRTVAGGLTNRQVSEQLFISDATVRHHLCAIFDKLGVASRGELIVYAYRNNLADLTALEAHG
ncbi:MAG TPA: response regulator transcription factor [Thermoanaerobaculia bacterium]